MWRAGVKCDRRAAGNTLRGTGGWVCGSYGTGQMDRQREKTLSQEEEHVSMRPKEKQKRTNSLVEQRDAHVHISAQMHTDTDIHIKTHTEAIKQPTSLVPSALCRGRVAQLFPHHSASAVPARPEPSVDNCSAKLPVAAPVSAAQTPRASNFTLP